MSIFFLKIYFPTFFFFFRGNWVTSDYISLPRRKRRNVDKKRQLSHYGIRFFNLQTLGGMLNPWWTKDDSPTRVLTQFQKNIVYKTRRGSTNMGFKQLWSHFGSRIKIKKKQRQLFCLQLHNNSGEDGTAKIWNKIPSLKKAFPLNASKLNEVALRQSAFKKELLILNSTHCIFVGTDGIEDYRFSKTRVEFAWVTTDMTKFHGIKDVTGSHEIYVWCNTQFCRQEELSSRAHWLTCHEKKGRQPSVRKYCFNLN